MKDQYKTKKQLIEELEVLRNQLAKPKKTKANRKRAEETLPESEETFKALAENANDGILITIGKGVQVYANKRASEITGYSVAKLLKMGIKDLVHPDELKKIMERRGKRLTGEPVPPQYETIIIHKDGKSLPIELTAAKTVWQGQPAVLVIIRDIAERKRAEEALKESESRFRNIIESSKDGIVFFDGKTRKILFGNSTMAELLGCSKEDLVGRSIPSLHPSEEWESIEQEFQKHVSGEISLSTGIPVLRNDGSVFYADISSSFITLDGRSYFSAFFRDITERKQTEDTLRESEERYRRIVDNSLMGIGISRGNQVIFANPGLLRLFGYDDLEEFTKVPLLNHVAPASHELIAALMEKVAKGETLPAEFEYDILCKDGRTKTLLASSQLFTLGGATYGQTTFQDITERKRAEEALQEMSQTLEAVIQASPLPIFAVDRELIVKAWNPAAERTFGWSAQEVIGRKYPAIPKEKMNEADTLFLQALEGGLTGVETHRQRKDGSLIDVSISAAPLRDGCGNTTGVMAVITDITERKRAEEKLKAIYERLNYLLTSTSVAIYTSKTSGDYGATSITDNIKKIAGYEPREFIENQSFWIEHVHPEDRKRILNELPRLFKQGTHAYEYRFLYKDGHYGWLRDDMRLITDERNKPLEIIGYWIDISERKRAEKALRESEERFRLAFENANTGVCLVDLEGNLTKVNDKMCEIFGYTKEDLERMTVNDIAHPEDIDKSPAFIQRTLRGETDRGTFEKRYLHKKGHVVTCQVSSSLVRNADGFPLYFISHVHDITERKRAEEALREKQETINAIIETSQDWIWIIDSQGVHRYSNPAVEKILGYRAEEIVGGVSLDLMHEEDKKMVESMLPEWRGKKCGWSNLLLRWRHKNGTYRYLESNAVPILNSKGDLIGFQGVDRDITERKQAEELLQKEREISLSILENAPYGVALIDEGGKYIYINPEFTNITGYTLEDIPTGKDWFRKAFPDLKDRGRVIQVWKEDRSKGSMIIREFSIICKDGKIKEIEIRSTFLQDGRVVIVLHDITEQKRAQEKMESLQEQLRQSQKMEAIGRLAGGVAHDFNNLLTIIKGYSQLSLIELKEDSPLKKNIEHIHEATDRAANLVRQLLAFSRRQILEMKVLDLNAILTNLDNMLRRVIGEDIELTTILAEDLGRVKTDPGWIEQAIMNLVVNSRDAMPSGGKLTIETGNADLDEASTYGHFDVEPGRYVMLSVSDTGVGITPEVMERLFEPFFSTKEKDKGTGLGLSMAYGIVKQCGGDIWVYGEPGKGATFKIYLPRVDEPLEERREKVLGDEFLRGSETILLVEDEENVRKLTLRILERHGYKVLSARDGDDALLICEQFKDPIHLMLTDVVMPRMSGHELAKHLKSSHPKMKVLYMSGYTDNTIVLHGVLMEGVDFIQKPFTVDALTKKIREVLEQ